MKHLRYIGGGATLAELTRWEVPEAAAELAGRPSPAGTDAVGAGAVSAGPRTPAAPTGPPLPVQQMLLPADVADVTGFAGEFE